MFSMISVAKFCLFLISWRKDSQ